METKTEIKFVVLDLDGTLLNSEHKMSERNRDAVRKAIAQGVKVMLATGKTRKSAEPIIAELGIDNPGVFVQGLIIHNADGTLRHETTLDGPTARRAIQYAESQGFDVIAYSGNRLITKRLTDAVNAIAKYGEPTPEAIGSLLNQIGSIPMHKLIMVGGDGQKLRALRWQLEQIIGDQAAFTHGGVLTSLEVLPKGMGKAVGVKSLLKIMGANPENTLAIGDGDNDLDMLKMVGIGVAMGNAHEDLRTAVKYVVASNDEDGVAEALERFVLKQEKKAAPPEEAPKVEVKIEASDAEASPESKTEGGQA
jgi:Cof subfamily protein (haloacid dehalogenase superfamily)